MMSLGVGLTIQDYTSAEARIIDGLERVYNQLIFPLCTPLLQILHPQNRYRRAKDMGFESQRVLWLIFFSFASLSTQRCTCASQGMFSHRYSHSTIYGSAHCSLSSYFLVSLHRPMHSSLVELRCYRHISTDQLYLHFTIHFLLQWESRGVFVLLPKQQQNHW